MAEAGDRRRRLRVVFDEHHDAVVRYCLRGLSRDDANDAAAWVFVVVWRKIDDVPERDAVLPWLYGIARYEVANVRRAARRSTALRTRLGGLAEPAVASTEAQVIRRTEHQHVIDALASLSEPDREIVYLRSYEGLSTPEIATALGCSDAAARKRLSRALRRLGRSLGAEAASPATFSSSSVEGGS